MKYFVAITGDGIPNRARFFNWRFSKTRRTLYVEIRKAIDAPNAPYGKDIPADVWLQMSENVPKQNCFYDLALLTYPHGLLISERVKAYLEDENLLRGNEAVRIGLRDPKGRPIEQTAYLLRQLVTADCIDETKSSGVRWTTGDTGYSVLSKFSLDLKKTPKGIHLFRSSQYPDLLFMTEDLAQGFINAGFVGLDFVVPEKWRDDDCKMKISLKGPLPVAGRGPSKSAGRPPTRKLPEPLKPFLRARRGKWIEIDIKKEIFVNPVQAFVFDWEAIRPEQREELEKNFLFDSPLEAPEYVPFAVLHIDLKALAKVIGRKPRSLADALGMQNAGLLVSDAKGRVIYLDSGSRTDIATSPERLKTRPPG